MATAKQIVFLKKQFEFPRAHFLQYRGNLNVSVGDDVSIAFLQARDGRSLVPKQACVAITAVSRPPALIEYAVPFLANRMAGTQAAAAPVDINEFPSKVAYAVRAIEEKLSARALTLAKSLRWRCNAHGTQLVLKTDLAPFSWSLDARTWFTVYGSFSIEQTEWQFEYLDSIIEPEEGEYEPLPAEPLAFELLMEAQHLQFDNPRSALVIAVAAAEVGTKRCLKFIDPTLTEMLESPKSLPIVNLLESYYPKDSRARIVPSIIVQLRKAVFERDRLVHAGAFTLERKQLGRRLRAIEDLLRLFDVQMGHEWAEKFISGDTRLELGLPKLDPP